MTNPFTNPFVCPQCHGALNQLSCEPCRTQYGMLDHNIPWLIPEPQAALQEWALKFKHFLGLLDEEIANLKSLYKSSYAQPSTPKRLQKILQAKVEHKKLLEDLLGPLVKHGTRSVELLKAGGIALPPSQSLTGYYQNIHRDWSWDTDENEISLRCITSCLESILNKDLTTASALRGQLGRVAVLGAGAGRLAYDLHQTELPLETTAVDFNPLMLLVASRAFHRRSLKLFEFPIAPKSLGDVAVLQKCAPPAPAKPNLFLIGADALRTPFPSHSLDTVVTPWLVDILPSEPSQLLREIRRILKPQGLWIYFGSMTFGHPSFAFHHCYEEFCELVKNLDFKIEAAEHRQIPYMASPHSNHSRLERITVMVNRSLSVAASLGDPIKGDKSAPGHQTLPPWLVDFNLPIPRSSPIDSKEMVHRVSSQLLQLIDGQKSLNTMAAHCVSQGLLGNDEATAYMLKFLKRLYLEGSLEGR